MLQKVYNTEFISVFPYFHSQEFAGRVGIGILDEIEGGEEKERDKNRGRVHLNIDNSDSFR
jgi:hypothetical protein